MARIIYELLFCTIMLAPLYAGLFQAAPMGSPILLETEIKSIPIGVTSSKTTRDEYKDKLCTAYTYEWFDLNYILHFILYILRIFNIIINRAINLKYLLKQHLHYFFFLFNFCVKIKTISLNFFERKLEDKEDITIVIDHKKQKD